jgi:hypothetical protein
MADILGVTIAKSTSLGFQPKLPNPYHAMPVGKKQSTSSGPYPVQLQQGVYFSVTTGNTTNPEAHILHSETIRFGALPLTQLHNPADDMSESRGQTIATSLINALYSYDSIGPRLIPVLNSLPTEDSDCRYGNYVAHSVKLTDLKQTRYSLPFTS